MGKNYIELLAPAGDMEKLKTALHFGADAVYFAGKNYGLRAFAGNFEQDEIKKAIDYTHSKNKKAYITLNIFAKNADFVGLKEYVCLLQEAGADAVIVSDFGIMEFIKKFAPRLKIHVSTQANITNKYSAAFMSNFAERLILARELSLAEIAEIKQFVPDLTLETFVHGAMCISYSGRCLISDYLAGRSSNHGECAQSCRWKYKLYEENRSEPIEIIEDNRGSYILNSKDLNMIEHLDKLASAGVTSFKIEGRAKSAYYVGTTVNAYRRALDIFDACGESAYICPNELKEELVKVSHRDYSTGFYLGNPEQYYKSSKPTQDYQFCAVVTERLDGGIIIEQRNRFADGDTLEAVSLSIGHGKEIIVNGMTDTFGNPVTDALIVQQKLFLPISTDLQAGDMLRKKIC